MAARRSAWWMLAALAFCACNRRPARGETSPARRSPILLVGLDGFEWSIVLPMLREQRLPAVRGLMERGAFGLLQSGRPTASPILWTTLATGKKPAKHGIHDFVHPAVPGEERRLYTSQDRATKAFWNIFSDHGRRVDVVGWWLTFPVEPINGVMVAQANTLSGARGRGMLWKGSLIKGLESQVHPPEREASFFAVAEQAEKDMPLLMDRILGSGPRRRGGKVRASRWALRADTIYARIALDRLGGGAMPDLLAVYFGGADVIGHRFWPPGDPPAERPAATPGAGALTAYYAHLDTVLGALLARCPADATVIVLSDHGMGPHGHGDAPDGFLVAAGPSIRRAAGRPVAALERSDLQVTGSILDVTPTLLLLAGIPLARDMDGQVMEGILDPRFRALARSDPVASHDTEDWMAARRAAPRAPDVDPERLEQLRALGYVE